MGMLLAFAPFIAFALVERLAGPVPGLVAGGLVALALLARDRFTPGRTPKILEIGTALLFCGLALYAVMFPAVWTVMGVRLCVDGGLFVIVVASMVLGKPFTLQYARERVPREIWDSPAFIRTNHVITAAWAAAFAAMALAEAAVTFIPGIPTRAATVVIVLALVGAFKFTGWYPAHLRRA